MKTQARASAVLISIICLLLASVDVAGQHRSSLTGDWTGESICVGNNPSCQDEKVVYHVSVAGQPDKIKIAADKIVDGKPEPMGVIDLKYDASLQTLTGETQTARYRLSWEFTITGNIMEGTLSILPEKTIARRIRVQRKESTQKGAAAMTTHATGTFEVKLTPQDDKSDDKSLGRMTIEKQWHGDIEGSSTGQMLTGGAVAKGSAGYVAIEKVSGTLSGRRGTFILQHSATMTRGEGQLTITVVPDSGTDQLEGLTGKLTIKIADGKHSYDFEYALPQTP
jgi:uncharacterized protein DUF3224